MFGLFKKEKKMKRVWTKVRTKTISHPSIEIIVYTRDGKIYSEHRKIYKDYDLNNPLDRSGVYENKETSENIGEEFEPIFSYGGKRILIKNEYKQLNAITISNGTTQTLIPNSNISKIELKNSAILNEKIEVEVYKVVEVEE